MKKQLFYLLSISFIFCLLVPEDAEARKRRKVFKRKWSISVTNGYNIPSLRLKKDIPVDPLNMWQAKDDKTGRVYMYPEGQMYPFFSSLELSRNFGYYELGAKFQLIGPTFVSPFVKWNFIKNNSRAKIIPSLTWGISPASLMGTWLRLNLGFSLNRYASLTPFFGCYAWYNLYPESLPFGKSNAYCNTGLSINLYY